MDSSKDVHQALEAGEFRQAMGRPIQAEVLSMIQNRNVTNVSHSVDDVKWFYEIYGLQVAGIRGRTVKKHVKRQTAPKSASREDT
jgi:hypothetical protein